MASKVYFAPVEGNTGEERATGLKKLLQALDGEMKYARHEYVPVKVTIGDSGCVYNVSPELVKMVVSALKSKGAKPFLFDTNVIYEGRRQNAVDHLTLVQNKGFSHNRVGAPFIIADGVFGLDGKEFAVPGKHIRKIKVPTFVGLTDTLVVLSHATGHIVSGYAGAIKNVAMGLSCRPTKQVQHSALKPKIIEKKCTGCGCCLVLCPVKAISWRGKMAFIDQEKCLGCGECLCACKFEAILINWDEDPLVFARRMTEVAHCILKQFKNKLFINFAFDVTKNCDCISAKNDQMIARDIGLLASSDIVSLDRATTDLLGAGQKTDFLPSKKKIYDTMISYGVELGMGNAEYELEKW